MRFRIGIIISATITIAIVFVFSYSQNVTMYHGDSLGYYNYLPSVFIYNNLKTMDELPADSTIAKSVYEYTENMKRNGLRSPKGHLVNQYTYAVALMELPFFFGAHLYEKLMGYKANGYSFSYNAAIRISSIVYGFLGLLLTFLVLKKYFDTLVSLTTVCILFLGTNLFWFTVHQPGMCHPVLFFLYAVLIYTTIKLYEHPRLTLFASVGILVGFITIMRPTDFVAAFIPLCFGVYNAQGFKGRLSFINKNRTGVLLLFMSGVLPLIPQMMYWKILTGSYFYYSYGSQSFIYLKHPRVLEGLFSFSNGFFPYAPIMLLAVAGLLFYKPIRNWLLPICIISPVYVWLIYSWFGYNYPNGLGSRPMIHLFALYAFPLAAFMQFALQSRILIRAIAIAIILCIIGLNFEISRLKAGYLLLSEETNWKYYLHMLGKTKMTYNDFLLHDTGELQPDETTLRKITTVAYLDFEDSTSNLYIPDNTGNAAGKFYYKLSEEEFPAETIRIVYSKAIFKDAKWLKASGRFLTRCNGAYLRHVLSVSVKREDETIKWRGCALDTKIGMADKSCKHIEKEYNVYHTDCDFWGAVFFYTSIPDDIKEGDIIEVNVWNPYKAELLLDDIKLELYK